MAEEGNDRFLLLVVDDEFDNREVLVRRLKRRGFRVLEAESGQQALDLIDEHTIDLVLLDINMPGMSGLEVLERLRQLYTPMELPVVMQTARGEEDIQIQTAELGANDHVVKPIQFKILSAKVQALLRAKASSAPPSTGARTELREGAVIDGKYRLLSPIGAGTFGTVFRALHLRLEQDVAIKFLQPSVTATAESRQRFRREGVATGKVRHPNAVAVTDSGITEDGVAYLVMELLQGMSLAQEMKDWGRIRPRRVGELLLPICAVLEEAHAAGLVHRDIKPENIYLHQGPTGEMVKVLDFGIAKLVGEEVAEQNLTAEGWVLGTPAYMAPERVSNRPYDGRADVYSLGVMVYEMLAGRRPFLAVDGDPMGLLMRHVKDPPPPLSSLWPEATPDIEQVVSWALAKEPAERPTAGQLAEAFRRALAASPSLAGGDISPAPAPAVAPALTAEGSGGASTDSVPSSAVDASAPTIAIRSDVETERESSVDEGGKGWFNRLVDRLKGS